LINVQPLLGRRLPKTLTVFFFPPLVIALSKVNVRLLYVEKALLLIFLSFYALLLHVVT